MPSSRGVEGTMFARVTRVGACDVNELCNSSTEAGGRDRGRSRGLVRATDHVQRASAWRAFARVHTVAGTAAPVSA